MFKSYQLNGPFSLSYFEFMKKIRYSARFLCLAPKLN